MCSQFGSHSISMGEMGESGLLSGSPPGDEKWGCGRSWATEAPSLMSMVDAVP